MEWFVGMQHLPRVVLESDDQRLFACCRGLALEKIDQRGVPEVDAVKHAYCGDCAALRQAVVFA